MPAFGKTGTTNDYNNAYFAGFFPMPKTKGDAMQFENNMTIASYVGYDLNKTMKRGGVKVTGAVGALPVWIDYVKLIIEKHKFADLVDPLDISVVASGEWPMQYERGVGALNIDLPRGTVLRGADSGPTEVFGTTEIVKTGESPDNEFAIGNQVSTVIRIPTERDGALRLFSLFKILDGNRNDSGPGSAPVQIDDKRLPGGNLPLSVLGDSPGNGAGNAPGNQAVGAGFVGGGYPGANNGAYPGPVAPGRLGTSRGAEAYDPSNDIMPHEADFDDITPVGKTPDKAAEKSPSAPKDAKLNNPPEKPVRGIGAEKPAGTTTGGEGDLW